MISAVIPVLNNIIFTETLLSNISENVVLPTEIILIDNRSDDDYVGLAKKYQHLNIRYFKYNTNVGVNAAWNLGIKCSRYNLVSILNNDILINKYFFKKIIDTMNDDTIGICVPNTIKDKEFFNEDDQPNIINIGDHVREGWAFTLRKNILLKYGPISNNLRMFYGDDYLFLASLKSGYRNVRILNNIIFHFGSITVNQDRNKKCLLRNERQVWLQIKERM